MGITISQVRTKFDPSWDFSNASCGFLMDIFRKGFKQERLQGEKRGFIFAWAEYYLRPNTVDDIAHLQAIICRWLFAGHKAGSWPMKGKTAWKESSVR